MTSAARLIRIKRTRTVPTPLEHAEAVEFMRLVRMHEARYPALKWLHAIPNGARTKLSIAKKLKAEGLRAGVHDYSWPFRTATHPGLYLELKSMTGSASKEQREFAAFAESQGFKVVFAKGWEAAWRAVCEYAGIPFRVI